MLGLMPALLVGRNYKIIQNNESRTFKVMKKYYRKYLFPFTETL